MTTPVLTTDEVNDAAAWFSRTYTGWTWPELLRALESVLPAAIARDALLTLLTLSPNEPRHPVEALRRALKKWTQPPAKPTIVPLSVPPRDTIADGLPQLYSVLEVAQWLDLTIGELEWFADHGGWLRTAPSRLRHYRVWTREKRDGVRVIEAPKPRLREAQRRLLRLLVSRIPVHPAARGFIPGSSTADFAQPHSGKATVLRVDLRHCFESITSPRIAEVFRRAGYPPAIARVLADLCTTATPADQLAGVPAEHAAYLRGRHLPQGAPTSPHLSNLVMRSLDRRLDGYARANGLAYTRYGDDLALSGDAMDADRALWVVLKVIASEGFTVHAGKVRIMRQHQRQSLAGLVINDRPRVSRSDYDNLRALLHNVHRHGASSQNHSGHPDFRAHVLGLIAWIGSNDPARRERLLRMANEVDWAR
ncbi:reverse transcriptase family protein [Dietzia kunjamensis]|uniref:reverse transcriptase family protein n=1 Tax=Dietzia kunjamensis TaxID=322509 RepID=UPI002DB6E843|nr:reverse transcriptase family protein [Dietzia kunjamensis]MEB8325218.1 reverse transcriptase family protein [Dietzia kunjamensis]